MSAAEAVAAPTKPRTLRLSPTAIGQWETCPRSWYYGYVIGPRPPQSAAMALGTAIHSEVERFLGGVPWGSAGSMALDRTYRNTVAMARAGESFLRPLVPRVAAGFARVEVQAEYPAGGAFGPLPFSGRIDLVDDPLRFVLDHKTTSDLRAPWHPGPAELAHDTQMLLYASAVLPPGEPVSVAHLRYRTKGDPLAELVVAPGVPWAHVEEEHAKAVGVSRAMAALATHPVERVGEVEWRAAGCRKYGGCPFAGRCPDSPDNRAARVATLAVAVQSSQPVATATTQGGQMSASDVMSLFAPKGAAQPPSNGAGAVASTPVAPMPAGIAALLTRHEPPGGLGASVARDVANVVPPDARPDDAPPLARAVAAIRALGGWPGPRAASAVAAQHGVGLEALAYAATEAGVGPSVEQTTQQPTGGAVTQQSHSTTPAASNAPTTPETSAAQGAAQGTKKDAQLALDVRYLRAALYEATRGADMAVAEKLAREGFRAHASLTRVGGTRWDAVVAAAVASGAVVVRPDGAMLLGSAPTVAEALAGTPSPALPTAPDGTRMDPAIRLDAALPTPAAPSPGLAQRALELRAALGNSRTGSLSAERVREVCGVAAADVVALAVAEGWLSVDAQHATVELVDLPPEVDSPVRVPAAATARALGLHFVCLVLVDAVPLGRELPSPSYLRDAPAIAAAIARVEAREQCPVDLVGYGKGPAMVVADLRGVPVCDPGIWLADARDPLAAMLLPVLLAAGAVVVRGVR